MNSFLDIDWTAAAIAIAEAMCNTSDLSENEHLLSLPMNGALMFYVDELSYFELAARNEPDEIPSMRNLERDAPGIEWKRGGQS